MDNESNNLFFGICSQIGVNNKEFINLFINEIELYDYKAISIKVSDLIEKKYRENNPEENNPEENITTLQRKMRLIEHGNALRKKDVLKSKDKYKFTILQEIILKIKEERTKNNTNKIIFIIDSIKNKLEYDHLKLIYGSKILFIGLFAEYESRLKFLINKEVPEIEIENLIKNDNKQVDEEFGQQTGEIIQLSDFLINLTENNNNKLKFYISRICLAIFDFPYLSPTFDEFAMYTAKKSSFRSSDLSRQVGAVLTKNNEIISIGVNDVPRYRGGQYWTEYQDQIEINGYYDQNGGKDYTLGVDTNKQNINYIIEDIINKTFPTKKQEKNKKKLKNILLKSSISDLIEFGRMVHAEMESILACCRLGISTKDTILYCTTFPCHNCTKHIIDAGIRRVLYIEPYNKSKALEFHKDSLSTRDEDSEKKVIFQLFSGISPNLYEKFFKKIKRKNNAETIKWEKKDAKIRNLSNDFFQSQNERDFNFLEAENIYLNGDKEDGN